MESESFKIFIGWSRPPSYVVAKALKSGIEKLLPLGVKVFVSNIDIVKGSSARPELVSYLREADAGIFIITPETASSEYINSEVGGVICNKKNKAGDDKENLVNAFLVGMKTTDTTFRETIKGLLRGYQAVDSDEADQVKAMMQGINDRLDQPLRSDLFNKNFPSFYDELSKVLSESQIEGKLCETTKDVRIAGSELTHCELDVLWAIYETGITDESYFVRSGTINALITTGRFSDGEINRAYSSLQRFSLE